MPKYHVTVACQVYASKTMTIRAADQGAAEEKAIDRALAGKVRWETDADQTDEDYQIVETEEVE